jgi:hypothetical protein
MQQLGNAPATIRCLWALLIAPSRHCELDRGEAFGLTFAPF